RRGPRSARRGGSSSCCCTRTIGKRGSPSWLRRREEEGERALGAAEIGEARASALRRGDPARADRRVDPGDLVGRIEGNTFVGEGARQDALVARDAQEILVRL